MAVDRSWRSADRRYLIDQVVDEPGVEYRVWDAEGVPVGEAAGPAQLRPLLAALGVDPDRIISVSIDDPWCE